jgi:CheY-like chemotaxis protein
MGGRIWVESDVGQGSVFSFSVPFEIWAGATLRSAVPIGTGPEPPLPALRILLAEDSPDNCTIAIAYLEGTPYRVDIAETGAIACEMFAAGHYDMVLMDRQMPVMDGLTATRTIRAWEHANDRAPTPIIALTASALKGDREKCLAAGCTAFLTKPIKQEVLLQAIKEFSAVASAEAARASAAEDPIRVCAHPVLAARIPAFLEHRRQDVATMKDALARADFETIERLGHGMRGAGTSFGFPVITDIGADLEKAAGCGDADAARGWVEELDAYLDGLGSGAGIAASPPSQESATVPAAARRRIVLVDDSDDLRESFREVLELSGHHVTEARDGIAGLARILAERPDVAMVDISLPGMDGYEVARQVRAALGASVVLVAMTGYGRESDRIAALAAGFDSHLPKPVDLDRMHALLGVSVTP